MNETDPDSRARMERLDEQLAQLETSAVPERDLWPGIVAGVEERPANPTNGWRLVSLAATVMIGALAAVYLLPGGDPAEPTVAENTDNPAAPVAELPFAVDAPATQLTSYPGEAYGVARNEGLAELRERIQSLPPEQRAIVETNLATIRKALTDIDTALADDPDSKALKELLVKTYQRELDTINNVSRIAQSVRVDL